MKFYLNDGIEVDLSEEISKSIVVVDELDFWKGNSHYIIHPLEFKIHDVYFMISQLIRNNPGKKIFVHHFEPLANDFYAMYYAIEA